MESNMSILLCRLCFKRPAIENSHVISALVFRAIKSDSPTGFFRNPNSPNRRLQDGDKLQLLCTECEQRFGKAEGQFASNVFLPFHGADHCEFSYGPWLHYFMTSLAWRTLILDLPGLESDPANPRKAITELVGAAETMRLYLLGATHLAPRLENHAVAWTKGDIASAELAAVGPNVIIRRSTFGYTILDQEHEYSAILHNLAGFMCFLIVRPNPTDTWIGTKVDPMGGQIKQPQQVNSWLIFELLKNLIESAQKQAKMSEDEREKIRMAIRRNPSAPALRFRELDKRIIVND